MHNCTFLTADVFCLIIYQWERQRRRGCSMFPALRKWWKTVKNVVHMAANKNYKKLGRSLSSITSRELTSTPSFPSSKETKCLQGKYMLLLFFHHS
mmetsp:Transcript_21056/g.29521  ORF Transcript_21056/g.29521 Transcript_21056/m.29521 type:complete len:96 (-) Transcript_21056:183-470(-)